MSRPNIDARFGDFASNALSVAGPQAGAQSPVVAPTDFRMSEGFDPGQLTAQELSYVLRQAGLTFKYLDGLEAANFRKVAPAFASGFVAIGYDAGHDCNFALSHSFSDLSTPPNIAVRRSFSEGDVWDSAATFVTGAGHPALWTGGFDCNPSGDFLALAAEGTAGFPSKIVVVHDHTLGIAAGSMVEIVIGGTTPEHHGRVKWCPGAGVFVFGGKSVPGGTITSVVWAYDGTGANVGTTVTTPRTGAGAGVPMCFVATGNGLILIANGEGHFWNSPDTTGHLTFASSGFLSGIVDLVFVNHVVATDVGLFVAVVDGLYGGGLTFWVSSDGAIWTKVGPAGVPTLSPSLALDTTDMSSGSVAGGPGPLFFATKTVVQGTCILLLVQHALPVGFTKKYRSLMFSRDIGATWVQVPVPIDDVPAATGEVNFATLQRHLGDDRTWLLVGHAFNSTNLAVTNFASGLRLTG